jgi:hypothetical protein
VRAFAKMRVRPEMLAGSDQWLSLASHLVVSAGSKMQANLFAVHAESGELNHICKYNQQVFKPSAGRKEFEATTEM